MIMTNVTSIPEPDTADMSLVDYGRMIVRHGRLSQLRVYLGLTPNAMAELLHTTPITYTNWEVNPDVRLWPSTAQRIGAFHKLATAQIRLYENEHGKESLKGLVPFHVAAMYCGLPHELLLRWYREGEFNAVELGVLGLWVERDEIALKLKRVIP